MRTEDKFKIANCVANLYEAVAAAGGSPRGILDMTMREFVVNVAAQNGIGFAITSSPAKFHSDAVDRDPLEQGPPKPPHKRVCTDPHCGVCRT